MRFLLDTDTCIYAMKDKHGVLDALLSHKRTDVALSVITEAELRTGAAKSTSPKKTLERLESFLAPIQVLDFTSDDAIVYAKVRAGLEKKGQPIGPMDLLIGSHALSRGLVLVTNNQDEFKRIPKLKRDNWAEA